MPNDRDQQTDDLLDRMTAQWRQTEAPDALPDHVAASILRAINKTETSTTLKERMFTMIRKARYPGAAAAGLLIAAVLGWLVLDGGAKIAFADVVEGMREFRSVRYTWQAEVNGEIFTTEKYYVLADGRMRREAHRDQGHPWISIVDPNQNVVLSSAGAGRMTRGELTPGMKEAYRNPLEQILQMRGEDGELIGMERLDGRKVLVFQIESANILGFRTTPAKLWVDPDTQLPVQIRTGEKTAAGAPIAPMILKDFVWNEPLDESLFDVSVPAGYIVEDVTLSNQAVESIPEVLRLYAEASGGSLPRTFDERLVPAYLELKPDTEEDQDAKERFVAAANSTLAIVEKLHATHDWHYAGEGHTTADSKRSIVWFRKAANSKFYYVIFADLRIHLAEESILHLVLIPQEKSPRE